MEVKPVPQQDLQEQNPQQNQGAGRKRVWQVISPVALALFLAACSSGIETTPPELTTTATDSLRTQVRSSADDAEEASSGKMVTGSSAKVLDFSGEKQKVGLRFTGVEIPQDAEITKAYIRLLPASSDSGSTTLTIKAHDTDSASQFKAARKNISSRSLTSASVRWQPSSWRKGKVEQSSDLSKVVQEVVNRNGWDSGNALALIVSGDNKNERRAVSHNGGGNKVAPTLYVWYESDGSDEADEGGSRTAPSSSVSSSQREWHKRLLASIKNPRYRSELDPKKLAASGDLYRLGRDLNNNLSGVMMAYRETGDRDLARHLDAVMNIAKSKLRDTNGDGYKNWTYKHKGADRTSRPYVGTDKHVMDEMMTHSMVAAAAYTLKQAGFSSSARFWTDYLKNDFEAKWRKRNNKRSGFPFIKHFLMHPTTQFVRYNYYMYKLTGQSSYYSEAKRLAGTVKNTMRSSGGGYVWAHQVSRKSGCQPTVYVKYTTQAFADLASANSSLFSSSFMKRVAKTMANKVLKSSSGTKLAANVCGSGSYGNVNMFAQHPFIQVAPWDSSNRLQNAAERAYAATERRSMSSPKTSNLAAQLVFTLGR